MSSFSIAPAARRDLEDLVDYIALDSPAAAHRVVDMIADAFQLLAARPGLGHSRKDLTARNLRFWSVRGRHTIVYRERAAGIEIVRVFSAGRDVSALLGQEIDSP